MNVNSNYVKEGNKSWSIRIVTCHQFHCQILLYPILTDTIYTGCSKRSGPNSDHMLLRSEKISYKLVFGYNKKLNLNLYKAIDISVQSFTNKIRFIIYHKESYM